MDCNGPRPQCVPKGLYCQMFCNLRKESDWFWFPECKELTRSSLLLRVIHSNADRAVLNYT